MDKDSSQEFGKKVFLLNPPSVIKDEMVKTLIDNEYEVYLLQEHRKAVEVFKAFPDSIVFINIDHTLKDAKWESWEDYIKLLMSSDPTSNIKIGILSYESDKKLIENYLMEIMVPCGFVKLSLGLKESTGIIMKALDANEAKSRRKYVRIKCREPMKATLSIQREGKNHRGTVSDLSSVGMSFKWDGGGPSVLANKEYIEEIQLRLKGKLCIVSGHVIGRRDEGQTVYVIIFGKNTRKSSIERIHEFIYDCLQYEMEQRLKAF